MNSSTKMRKTLITVVTLLVAVSSIVYFTSSRYNIFPQIIASALSSFEKTPFPIIDEAELSAEQQKVIEILQREYELQPSGAKYSEGVSEPWCADFVSWVYNEAGVPLRNPNSGSWRIPGTYTLREYYESAGRFVGSQEQYEPKIGDVMLYDNPSSFGQHTNIVIAYDGNTVTTIGGNELGRIRISEHTGHNSAGFVGYGVF